MSKLHTRSQCLETPLVHIMQLPEINWQRLGRLVSVSLSGKPQQPAITRMCKAARHTGVSLSSNALHFKGFAPMQN